MITVFMSYSLVLLGPIIAFIYNNQYVIPTGVILPYVDPDTLRGFIINCCLQGITALIGTVATIGVSTVLTVCDTNIYIMKVLIKFHVKQFDKSILKNNTEHQLNNEFLNLLYMMEDFKDYVDALNDIMYYKKLVQPFLTKICAAIAIYCHYKVWMHTWWLDRMYRSTFSIFFFFYSCIYY